MPVSDTTNYRKITEIFCMEHIGKLLPNQLIYEVETEEFSLHRTVPST